MTARAEYFTYTLHFTVTADNFPGSLPRVLSVFERQDLCPDLVKSSKFTGGQLAIDIYLADPGERLEERLSGALLSLIGVRHLRREKIVRPSGAKLAS